VLVLVLDTSTPAVTAALARISPQASPAGAASAEVVAERSTVDARAHGELLAPAIEHVLTAAGARAADLTAVVAGLGPGPFTGLRVGLVTAATIGQALAIPSYGVCSLDAIGAQTTGRVLVATDARRKEIYWAVYQDGARDSELGVARPVDVVAWLAGAQTAGVAATVGDGAVRYAGELGLPVLDAPRYPPAVALAGLAADRVRRRAPGEVLTPLYLRRPDAVEPGPRKPVGHRHTNP
jgi:tRNA threonylcarbamoyl adenosine modification protein YeaZ